MVNIEKEVWQSGVEYLLNADVEVEFYKGYGAHPDLGGGRTTYEANIVGYDIKRLTDDGEVELSDIEAEKVFNNLSGSLIGDVLRDAAILND